MKSKKSFALTQKHKKIFFGLGLFFFVIGLFLTLEVLNTKNIVDAYLKIFTQSNFVFLSCLAIFFLLAIIFSLTGNLFFSSFILSLALYFFYLINFYRREITGWVFVPSDLNFFKSFTNISSFARLRFHYRIIAVPIVIFFLICVLFFGYKGSKIKFKIRSRAKIFFSSILIFLFMFCSSFSRINILPLFGLDTRIKFTSNQIYDKYGAIMGFYTMSAQKNNLKPENYNRDTIKKIADKINQEYPKNIFVKNKIKKNIKPNIIIIMSEAFADPTRWSNINFSEEPIPNFKNLSSKSIFGNLITPSFGGSTCNVEYEFNTCNAMYFFEPGAIPYEDYKKYFANENLETIPKIFKNNGYKTIGLHTYDGNFFNRKEVYKILGFDKFICAEDMKNAEFAGSFISDKYFTDQIINILEKKDKPIFLYGITMENHYPFEKNKFQEPDKIKAESDFLNQKQIESLESYLHGINDADRELKRLTDYLKNFAEPSIVIFFGDHLPILNNSGYEFFYDIKYISDKDNSKWKAEDFYKMYTTPYLIWNNFDNKNINLGDISPYFLSNYILDYLDFEKPLEFKFMNVIYQKICALKENLCIDKNGKKFDAMPDRNLENMYFNLQYDSVFGENFLSE